MVEPNPEPGQPPLRIRPLRERKNLVRKEDFAQVLPPVDGFLRWFEALPDIYGAKALKRVVDAIVTARQQGRLVGVSLGAHVLKVGLSPLLIDLMRRGLVGHVATNGASAIHDWETAYQGATSEDVARNLPDGSFGFWRETLDALNGAAKRAQMRGEGYGEAIGRTILDGNLPHRQLSVFAEAVRLGVPATVHVAFGCDITHMDPALDGAALGAATQRDFWTFADSVGRLGGGVWLNIGSAVIMPEVFLKAVSIARNRGQLGDDFLTCNFDMLQQYRAMTNVVQRPPKEGKSILAMHEIVLPLLHQALLCTAAARGCLVEPR
ncbi:MAG: hypothetical protein K8J09_12095 [Planctomycetes bacterium]|nr:hypothetical protein [Planctomycetota bacterium]MCC7395585.1 hypothetical protein [Planctomycetota bacterium]